MEAVKKEDSVLRVERLSTAFYTRDDKKTVVTDVSFSVRAGEILGIVGESGCGKSVTSLSVLNLLADNAEIQPESSVSIDGKNLVSMKEKELRKIRGNEIAMIYQDPMTSLNPVTRIGEQLIETIRTHRKMSKKDARIKALEMLKKVGVPSPERRLKEYPFQLSGGLKQRIVIAMALLCDPKIIIADEPTTALDVTIQAQILQLLKDLRKEIHVAIILITHDMGVVAAMADNIAVMYAGQIVEYGPVKEVFVRHRHPYTQGLLESIPRLDKPVEELQTISGAVPERYDDIEGCRFAGRCEYCREKCRTEAPQLNAVGSSVVRCHIYR